MYGSVRRTDPYGHRTNASVPRTEASGARTQTVRNRRARPVLEGATRATRTCHAHAATDRRASRSVAERGVAYAIRAGHAPGSDHSPKNFLKRGPADS